MSSARPRPAGTRTDLACPKCEGRMGALAIRQHRQEGSEPGFPPFGRECDACGFIEFYPGEAPARQACQRHKVVDAYYKRAPRPSRAWTPRGRRCRRCRHLDVEPDK